MRILTNLGVLAASILVALLLMEGLLALFFPQSMMYPRYQYSKAYGHVLPTNTQMVAERPGHWRYVYTINADGYRGPLAEPAAVADRTKVVVLGDSYSMGAGVQDEETFSRILQKDLGPGYWVVNLGIAGYGLAQEIRFYYEHGRQFDPAVVVLQYTDNDLNDMLYSPVATVDGDRFVFHDVSHSGGGLKELMQDSFLQHSHVYNLLRSQGYLLFKQSDADAAAETIDAEAYYLELLSRFALELHQEGRVLLMISADGQLDLVPALRQGVDELQRQGLLTYLEARDWLAGMNDYGSPEGHIWGASAHKAIGEGLARYIARLPQGGAEARKPDAGAAQSQSGPPAPAGGR